MQAKLQQALALHQRGQLRQARALYEDILAEQPRNADATQLLGVIAAQTQNPQQALDLFDRALAIDPANARTQFNRATTLRDLGRWQEALAGYERAIALDPHYADAHFNRGIVAMELQQWDAALASYERAIEIEPDHAEAYCNRTLALQQLGRPAAALDSAARAIALKPALAEAHCGRGLVLMELGDARAALASFERAIALKDAYAQAIAHRGTALAALKRWDAALASYDQALAFKPDFAEAWSNRGLALAELRRLGEALASYDRAIALRPDLAEVHSNRGLVLAHRQDWEAALASHERALALKPGYAKAHCNRGNVLKELRRWNEALDCYERAIALKPDYAEAHLNRGVVLFELARFDEALGAYERALEFKTGYAEAHYNRGIALKELGRLDESLVSYDRAIALRPDYAEAHSNRGLLLCEQNQVQEALASYDRAIALNPELTEPHYNRAIPCLLAGDYANGWRDYEWRWKLNSTWLIKEKSRFDTAPFSGKLWRGDTSIAGKTVLLLSEQGFGDTIQFCRLATRVAAQGARVIMEVPRVLARLVATVRGVERVVALGDELPPFDHYCPLLSLPFALDITLATLPAHVPYLRADPDRVRHWEERLGPRVKPRVGLVWSGGFRPAQPELWSINKRRNIPLQLLAPLEHPGIEFHTLQKGQPAEAELAQALAAGWGGPVLRDFTGELHDFAETAALLEQLDLVIAVDTSTAHLAAALGKPVWMMNRFDTCWRWLLERSDSPWYPTLRLYRQDRSGDWEGVVERVRRDLDRWQLTQSMNPPPVLADKLRRAAALHRHGDLARAQALYQEILEVRPLHYDALHLSGVIAVQSGRPEQALGLIDAALAVDSSRAEAHYNRGRTLQDLQRWEAARDSYDRALEIRPDYADAHLNRGMVRRELKQQAAALADYDRAIALNPASAPAHSNRGNLQRELGAWDAALASYDAAIAVDATFAEAYCNRGNVFKDLQRLEPALADYERALALKPGFAQAHINRALAWLLRGDFARGWPEFEWRRHADTAVWSQPPWLGREALAGKTLLLHSEQGYGDTIQFSRYATLAAARGARVLLAVPDSLADLLASIAGVGQVITPGAAPPPFDYHCPLLSLPLAFSTTLDSVPAPVPYLRCDALRLNRWRERLGERRKPRVGLVWSGGLRPQFHEQWTSNVRRNIPLADFAPLQHPDIDFFSLQKGGPAEAELAQALAAGWNGPALIDHGAELQDFADTAALIEQLDLLITVDTAAAHLAGALGKPVWILNRFDTCWRWLLNRDDSPWYPTARLYRQERPGEWVDVIARIRRDLDRWLSTA